jgi:hypothetical protein
VSGIRIDRVLVEQPLVQTVCIAFVVQPPRGRVGAEGLTFSRIMV